MVEKANVPTIRFKGFNDPWEQRRLGDESTILAGGDINKSKLKENGKFPVFANALTNDGVVGYYDDEFRIEAPAVTVTGRGDVGHAQARKVNFTPVVRLLSVKSKHDVDFLENAINNHKVLVESTGVPQLTSPQLGNYKIWFTSLEEQEKIGLFFSNLDNLITLHQRKYEKLQSLKKAFLERMFPKNGSEVPEIRFKGFNDPWKQRKLGELMNVASVKRIHQSNWTKKGVRFLRARDIVSAAKNEEPDDYLFISKEKYDEYSVISGKVAISDMLVTGVGTIGVPYLIRNLQPIYFKDGNIIWFQNNDKIIGNFFYYSFLGKAIQDYINKSAGRGTVGTYTIDSGKKTPISLPIQAEQIQIGNFFRHLDNLITLHQRKYEKLQNLKKALLERMFV